MICKTLMKLPTHPVVYLAPQQLSCHWFGRLPIRNCLSGADLRKHAVIHIKNEKRDEGKLLLTFKYKYTHFTITRRNGMQELLIHEILEE